MAVFYEQLSLVWVLVVVLVVGFIGFQFGKRSRKPNQISPSTNHSSVSLVNDNARERERIKQGGMSDTQLQALVDTLEEAQHIGAPEHKFIGRASRPRRKG